MNLKTTAATATILLAIPLIYALAIGPLMIMCHHRVIPRNMELTIVEMYKPLMWAAHRHPLVDRYVSDYVAWWLRAFPTPGL